MKAFITGAGGYVGKRLCSLLDRQEFSGSQLLARTQAGKPQYRHLAWTAGDLLDPATFQQSLSGCDLVIHLAAATGKLPRADYFRVNEQGTRELVAAAKRAGVNQFLHVSTVAVQFSDQSRYWYAQSKEAGERVVRDSGLRYRIVRPTMVFGPEAPVLLGLIKLASAPIVPVFGNGQAKVQPIAVDDLAAFLADSATGELPNDVVGAGGPDVLTIEELLARISETILRKPFRALHLPAGLIGGVMGLLEPVLLQVLPFTAGQMASFTNDSTAIADAQAKKRKGVAEVLALMASHDR